MDPELSVVNYLVFIVLLLIGGAYFAACETAFASVNEIRLKTYADDGNSKAKIALKIKKDFDAALTAILIGNNIMHITCSALATALVDNLWGEEFVSISTFVITFIVFLCAESIPKAYAKDCNEKVVLALSPSLNFFIIMLTPLTFIFKGLSNALSKLIGTADAQDITLSQEELYDIIENIDDEDKIEEGEAKLVKSALGLTYKKAIDVMIPMENVVCISSDMDKNKLDELIINGEYSRFPYFKDGSPIGVLQLRKYLKNKLTKKEKLISRLDLDKVVYVKEDKPIDEVLDYLSNRRCHLAFVKSKDNDLLGILTMEDILEELVGEIYDEEEKEKVKL